MTTILIVYCCFSAVLGGTLSVVAAPLDVKSRYILLLLIALAWGANWYMIRLGYPA